jgi:hypothetical protein
VPQLGERHLHGLDGVAVPERPLAAMLADDHEHVPVAVGVDERSLPARAEDDEADDVRVASRVVEQRLKHAPART